MTESPLQLPTSDTQSTGSPPQTAMAGESRDEEWQIGDWSFRPLLHRLSRDGEHVRLEPKVSDLLYFLARRARQPVSKDSIFEGVWEQRFLGDSALTRTMAELRRALGDDARQPIYIETIPKIGYRLIADVRCLPAPQAAVGTSIASESAATSSQNSIHRHDVDEPAGQVSGRLARLGPWIVVVILIVALASLYAVPTFRPTIGASPEALTAAEVNAEPMLVAVLPLDDLSHASSAVAEETAADDEAFFAAGMTEALEARLAQSGKVSVVSRHSVRRLLAGDDPLLERARVVGIDALVEGTVQRSGERVRITVRLTELDGATADRDTYSWVETYERDLRDVLALQAEVSRAIADNVRKTLLPAPVLRADTQETIDPEAYEVYLQARYVLNQRNGGWRKQAAELFERAVEMSSLYAPAHSGKARVYSQAAEHGSTVAGLWEGDLWEAALASAQTALALDPESTEAHGVTAMAAMLYRWDWQEAERHLLLALATNPSDAWIRQRYAYFLTFQGRFDEAIEQAEKALKLDPLSATSYAAAAHVYFHAGRYERVYDLGEMAKERVGESWSHGGAGYGAWAMVMEGRYDEALALLEPKVSEEKRWRGPTAMAIYSWTLAKAGRLDEAETVRQEMMALSYEDPFARAILETGLGDHDEAFAALGRALDERSHSIPYLKVEPFLQSLQDDPRFDPMVARLGL